MIAYWVGLVMGLWVGSAAGFGVALHLFTRDDTEASFDAHADQALQFNPPTFMEASDADLAAELGNDR